MVINVEQGQTGRVLLKSIQEIANAPVTLAPDDQSAEFANTHWLAVRTAERSTLSADRVVAALQQTARAIQRQIRATGTAATAIFYVWHDEQAGQLRCSVSSRTSATLPFGGVYRLTDDLGAIVSSFLDDLAPGMIAWDDLEPADGTDPADGNYPPFPVWTFDLGPDH
jgi:hypothetical protein